LLARVVLSAVIPHVQPFLREPLVDDVERDEFRAPEHPA